jgi:hypothetical protein
VLIPIHSLPIHSTIYIMVFSKITFGLLAAAVGLVSAQNGTYTLVDNYDSSNWDSMFTVFSVRDRRRASSISY